MKKILYILFLGVMALLWTNANAAEELTPAKREDIKRLLQATGAMQIAQTMSQAAVNQMSEAIKNARPDIPPQMFDIMSEEVNKTVSEEMTVKGGFVDLMVVLYNKYYTHEDIKGLLAFFESPLGKKASSLAPVMSREGFVIGQRWGQSLAPIIEERVKARFKEKGIAI
ncbi:MAG TPA: DUF2059 domain-containing protein [Candidatus Methylomirabilis sp.]|nr:DUF2059 domain-containing protein [Candidatus Methylomirabilis sp.]